MKQSRNQYWGLGPRLLAAALVVVALVASPSFVEEPKLVGDVQAADVVSVTVDVVRGTKGAQGSDQRSNKHRSVLARVPGYGGWKFLDALNLKLSVGMSGDRAVAGRKVQVSLESFAGGKARTRVVVTDPNGKPHKITSTLGKGGTTVLTAQSAGGREVHLFIVTVRW